MYGKGVVTLVHLNRGLETSRMGVNTRRYSGVHTILKEKRRKIAKGDENTGEVKRRRVVREGGDKDKKKSSGDMSRKRCGSWGIAR